MKKLNWIFALSLAITSSGCSSLFAQGFSDSLHYRLGSDTAIWNEELAAYTVQLGFEMKWDVPDKKVDFIAIAVYFDTTLFTFHTATVDTSTWWEKFTVTSVNPFSNPGRVVVEWDTPNDDTTISFTTGAFVRYGSLTFTVVAQESQFQGGITFARGSLAHASFSATWFILDSNYVDGTPVFLGVTETPCCNTPGDANNNGQINISDVTFVISRIFAGGSPAPCLAEADADANATLNIADVTFMIARIFAGGPAPSCVSTII